MSDSEAEGEGPVSRPKRQATEPHPEDATHCRTCGARLPADRLAVAREEFASGIVDLEAWVRGLDHRQAGRWPLAPLRAALAATRAALPASPCCPNHDDISGENFAAGCPSWPMTEAAIADAERCLAGEALTDRLPASAHGMTMHSAGYHLAEALWDFQCGHTRGSPNQTTCAWFEVERCAELAGEQVVRDAIRTELVSWALGGSP